MNQIKHLIFFLITLCLSALCMTPAMAKETIDPNAMGNVFLTLYQRTSKEGTATGLESDDPYGEPIEGMEFTLYPVKNSQDTIDYYNGADQTFLNVEDFLIDEEMDMSKVIKDDGYEIRSGETDTEGKITFENLPVGMYVLVQTNVPFNVVEKAPSAIISIPFSVHDEWHYDAYVFPKSEVNYQEQLILVKYGNGFEDQSGSVLLEGVTFSLLKKGEKDDWSDAMDVTDQNLVTNQDGKIVLNGLKAGEYRLKEESLGEDGAYILETSSYDFKVHRGKVVFEESFVGSHTYTVNGKEESYVQVDDNELSIVNYKPILKKSVKENEQSYTVGSRIHFNVDALIPLNVSQLETMVFVDTPTHIEFDEYSGVVLSVQGSNEIIPEEYYHLEKDEQTKGFVLTLVNPVSSSNFLVDWNVYAGKVIEISYKGILLASAGLNRGDNMNKVILYYSALTNVKDGPTKELEDKDGEVVIHTFELEVTKTLKGLKEDKSKKGVVFQIFNGNSTKEEDLLMFRFEDGKYVVDPEGNVSQVETDENGKIYVAGLGNGLFTFKETKTIYDYNLLKDPIVIKVDVKVNEDGSLETNSKDALSIKEDKLQLEIVNKKGIELPNTQGLTLIFLSLFGIVLLFIGFTYLNLHHKGE